MLAFFRHKTGSKIAIAILSLVVLAFILTGVFTREMPGTTSLRGGGSAGAIATVGDQSISPTDMEQRIRSQYTQAVQQQPGLDMAAFLSQAFLPIVDQTIGATAIESWGRSLGLIASKKQVDGAIAAVPAFLGPDGKFSQAAYRQLLQQQHVTDAQVRADFEGDILRRMVFLPTTGALTLPDGLVKPYANLLLELRAGSVGFVPVSAITDGTAPTDADVQNFYKAHIGAYTTPERRVLRYALIGRDQVAAKAVPTEAEIKQVYDSSADKYAARETRDLSQVVLDSQAKAQALKAALAGGKSFAEAALAAGFGANDTAIGAKTQAQFAQQTSAPVAAAAFALPQGGVSDPVKSDFGWHVVKVNSITRIPATPFEKARAEIAADLTKQKQDKALSDLVAKVQDGLDNGQGFADLTKANGLAVVETPAITAGGVAPDQPAFRPAPEVQPLLAPAFKANPDEAPTVETIQQGERYALLAVAHVVSAAPIPFAQVKDRVSRDFTISRDNDRAKAIAVAIQAKVKAGTPLADAIKGAPVTLPAPKPFAGRRMDLARLQGNVPAAVAAIFRAPVGSTMLVPGEGGNGWYIVHVDKVTPAEGPLLAQATAATRNEIVQAANNEYLEQLANTAKLAVGAHKDEGAIAALHARLLGITPAGQ